MDIFDNINANEKLLLKRNISDKSKEEITKTIISLKTHINSVLLKAMESYRVHEMLDTISWEGVAYVCELKHRTIGYKESMALISVNGKTYYKVQLDYDKFKYICDNKDIYILDNVTVALTELLRRAILKLLKE